jgi:hypothetical protein
MPTCRWPHYPHCAIMTRGSACNPEFGYKTRALLTEPEDADAKASQIYYNR